MHSVNDYELSNILGKGATAEVFAASKNGQRYAIKKFYPNLMQDHSFDQRFQKEFNLALCLKHPNIVQVIELIMNPPAVVMEIVDGESLDSLQKRLPFVFPELSLIIIEPILKALEFAHSQNIVHRDIKPSNILISKLGRIFLADFGLARLEGTSKLTLTGSVIGSPDFMSPEQARGEIATKSSDLFSLASVLYYLVTGTRPFTRSTTLATLSAVSQAQFEAPRMRNPKISHAYNAIIEKALSAKIEDRYSSAFEFRKAINNYLVAVGLQEESQNPEEYLRNWLKEPNNNTIACLQKMSAHLEESARHSLSRANITEASLTLSHLSILAPQSASIPQIALQIKDCSRKELRRRQIRYAIIPILLIVLIGSAITSYISKNKTLSQVSRINLAKESVNKESSVPDLRLSESKLPNTGEIPKLQHVEVKKPPNSKGSKVRFLVSPNVKVYWNNELIPKGAILNHVKKGEYQLKLERKGYQAIRETVHVDGIQPVTIRAR